MRSKCFSLESYALFAATLLGSNTLKSQIISQDFEPDLRLMNWVDNLIFDDSISIDIDGNGINDLTFNYFLSYYVGNLELEINDCVISLGVEESLPWNAYNIEFLSFGDQIDESLIWQNEGNEIFNVRTVFGSMDSVWNLDYAKEPFVDKYLPLKLQFGTDIYFGFVRLSIKTFGTHFFTGAYPATGSPLTIFSVSYNSIPNEPILCDENVLTESGTINEVRFYDDRDTESFNDFTFEFFGYTPDYSEIRIYLIPSHDDVINFSVNDALLLETSRYHSIPAAEVLSPNIIRLPETLLDINGNVFNPAIYYSAFYMKIPMMGDDISISLSTPLNLLRPKAQHCIMSVENINLQFLHTEGYFQTSFLADADEHDISAYGVGLADEATIETLSQHSNYEYIHTDALIQFPKTGNSSYLIDLIGLEIDVFGYTLIAGKKYTPVIYGFGDGFFRDLFCYDHEPSFVVYPLIDIKEAQMYYSDNLLTANIPIEMVGTCTIELVSITGQKIFSKELIMENTTLDLILYAEGIYVASIYQNNKLINREKLLVI